MDENAAAPATTGEAAPLTPNTEATAPATAPAEAPIFTQEQALEIKTFLDNNGGLEKVKKNLTMRQADQAQVQAQPQPQPQPQPQVTIAQGGPVNADGMALDVQLHPQPQQPASQPFKGGISTEEFMTQQYFESLSKREEYATVADQIRSGEVLKEMAKFNIQPMINGRINSEGIKDFMDLYAKTVPPAPAEAPVTATPTVEYVQVGETITNMNDAMQVLSQDRQLRQQGQAGHPMAEQAFNFFHQTLNAQQNRGKVTHTTLAEAKKK